MIGEVKKISDDYITRMREAGLTFQFGSKAGDLASHAHHLEQLVYGFVDLDFLREIMDNLLDNAIKYTPEGGSVYVGVRGDGDRVLINVTDSGIGISSDDLQHIFQKFYRSDNSDTREIGGTGLGLYLVKQRVEAMGGKVWAESAFGDGSTFYVSLPRLSGEEYEKRMIAVQNANMIAGSQPTTSQPQTFIQQTAPVSTAQPIPAPTAQPVPTPITQLVTEPAPQTTQQPAPMPAPQPVNQPVNQPVAQPEPIPQTEAQPALQQTTPVQTTLPEPQPIPETPQLEPSIGQAPIPQTPPPQAPVQPASPPAPAPATEIQSPQ